MNVIFECQLPIRVLTINWLYSVNWMDLVNVLAVHRNMLLFDCCRIEAYFRNLLESLWNINVITKQLLEM